ncbi:MAG TPA: prepilin-type N-terminal cleavage/methylation domain-containing protein [Chthoniobacterales bacterium]|nr:prepilin-type N-terminal cleavage/methylation domain-containing protein [Chthoniobacterales bacterium]
MVPPCTRSGRSSQVVRHWAFTCQPGGRSFFSASVFPRFSVSLLKRDGFTMLELLVVMGIMALLMVLVVPAFTRIKLGNEITTVAYTIAGALEQGRNYAMGNNTYVWVGFYEEDTTTLIPTTATPPYSGKGRVLIATVFSTDGTKIYEDSDPIAPLPPTRIKQLGRLLKFEGIHITDIGTPPSPRPAGVSSNTLDGRPDWPYTYAAGIGADHFNRISSDSADTTRFAFTVQNYTFSKTVRFNSLGEANINSTYTLKNAAELGLKPTHGTAVDNNSPNLVAIQFGGVGGNFRIYRR